MLRSDVKADAARADPSFRSVLRRLPVGAVLLRGILAAAGEEDAASVLYAEEELHN